MKLLSDEIVHSQGSAYLDFEVSKEERALLTSSTLIKLVKQIAPSVNLAYGAPRVMDNPDDNGNTKILINVAKPYKEQLVKGILTQYVKAGLLTLEEANDVYKPTCQILNIEFKSINPDESEKIEADKGHDFAMAVTMSLLDGIVAAYKPTEEQQVKKGNDDDFGSGLTGLRGIFNK